MGNRFNTEIFHGSARTRFLTIPLRRNTMREKEKTFREDARKAWLYPPLYPGTVLKVFQNSTSLESFGVPNRI